MLVCPAAFKCHWFDLRVSHSEPGDDAEQGEMELEHQGTLQN